MFCSGAWPTPELNDRGEAAKPGRDLVKLKHLLLTQNLPAGTDGTATPLCGSLCGQQLACAPYPHYSRLLPPLRGSKGLLRERVTATGSLLASQVYVYLGKLIKTQSLKLLSTAPPSPARHHHSCSVGGGGVSSQLSTGWEPSAGPPCMFLLTWPAGKP